MKLEIGLINEKCHLILILKRRLKKLLILEKYWKTSIHHNTVVKKSTNQKHLGIHLVKNSISILTQKKKIIKTSREIGLNRKQQIKLSRNALLTI